ncbi:MAG: lysine exporter LysO family protein, partial [Clostridiales bacterium]|nr:lysine exporter LysO family protein [Clostridiales bacterium]
KAILISVVCGMAAGYLVLPKAPFYASYSQVSGKLIMAFLFVLIFIIGIILGRDDRMIKNLKSVGFGILAFPAAAILGTFAFTAIASLFLPITAREAMACGCGFGWYSFAPVVLLDYSPTVSATAFLLNVIRELAGIALIPVLASKIGYIESTTLPGVAAMDVCLPIVEKATDSSIVVISFVMGAGMCITVPLTGFIVGL